MTEMFRDYPTLADIYRTAEQDETLAPDVRRRVLSDIRTFCRWVDVPMEAVRCHGGWFRNATKTLHHARLGVTRGRFNNVMSTVRWAVRRGCGRAEHGVEPTAIPERWKAAIAMVDGTWMKGRVAQLARFCADAAIDPNDVDASTFEALAAAKARCDRRVSADPETAVKKIRDAWNRAAAAVPAWPYPPVAKPIPARRVCVPLSPTIAAEWARFEKEEMNRRKCRRSSRDKLRSRYLLDQPSPSAPKAVDDLQPLRASTLNKLKEAVQQAFTALTKVDPCDAEHVSLPAIASPYGADILLEWLASRGIAPSERQITFCKSLKSIRRRLGLLTGADEEEFSEIIADFKEATGVQTGCMTAANRRRLAQFNDKHVLQSFILWPYRQFEDLERARRAGRPVTEAKARLAEVAVAHLILCTLPVRSQNLKTIDLKRHIIMPVKRNGPGVLYFEGHEVKNKRSIMAELSPEKMALLKIFLRHYRPVLVKDKGNSFLFGGRTNTAPLVSLSRRLPRTIRRLLGLEVTTHFYRHLMSTILLRSNPGGHRTVQGLLGHRHGSESTEYYAEFEVEYAAQELQNALSDFDQADDVKRRRRR
ncbi:tyrosine-type recombinase/integrase [Caenispirillum salinarum]|uniref:tyrosine-type recombinase/integrase n=1 Tax=Caenispirillum salinarum TaxID=859058 RepID=UPI00384D6060